MKGNLNQWGKFVVEDRVKWIQERYTSAQFGGVDKVQAGSNLDASRELLKWCDDLVTYVYT
jgi:hypothetical protein